jgi:hypothetical protein
LAIIFILQFPNGLELDLLLGLELRALVAEAVYVLVDLILLGLDGIKLPLDFGVLLAQRLGLGVVHAVLDGLDLRAQLVDLLLGVIELGKVLAQLAEARDLREGLLLVDKLHHAAIDLAVEPVDLLVDLIGILEGDFAPGGLLLSDTAADLLIEPLDLV